MSLPNPVVLFPEHEIVCSCSQKHVFRLKYNTYFELEDLSGKDILNLGTGRKISTAAFISHKAILEKNTENKIDRDLFSLLMLILFRGKRE